MTRPLVIDATGNIGRQVVRQFAANDQPVRALTRKSDGATMSPQVEVVQGDLTSPESLDRCLDGIDTTPQRFPRIESFNQRQFILRADRCAMGDDLQEIR